MRRTLRARSATVLGVVLVTVVLLAGAGTTVAQEQFEGVTERLVAGEGVSVLGLQSPAGLLPEAREYLRRGLEIDPSLPEAHAFAGMWSAAFDYDWLEAERRLTRATTGTPGHVVRYVYGMYLMTRGRPPDAVEQLRRAVAEDPLFVSYRYQLAGALWASGRDEEAVREWHQALEFDEHFSLTHCQLALYRSFRGEWSEARDHAQKAYDLTPHIPHVAGVLAGIEARTGGAERAEALIDGLGAPETFAVPRALVLFHLLQGDGKTAAEWWGKMIDQRDAWAVIMVHMPYAAAIRSYWPALARRMNLPV